MTALRLLGAWFVLSVPVGIAVGQMLRRRSA